VRVTRWDLLNPRVCGLRVSALWGLYRRRLKYHAVSELMAGSGIAIGVALVFGVLVANGSVLASTRQTINSVNGIASLKLAARSSSGFSDQIAERVGRLPGVTVSASILRQNAVIEGPRGRESVQLAGVTPGLVRLHGAATRDLGAGARMLLGGLGLPSGVAKSIGVQTEQPATLLVDGTTRTALVQAVLSAGSIGALSSSGIAVALLPQVQALAGKPHRVSEVLISTAPGKHNQVSSELHALAAGRLDVLPAGAELNLLEATAKPTNNTTTLFAAIGLMVGFLLAINAMMLTVPQRRRQIAQMRTEGFDSRQVLMIVISQSLILGVMSSLLGVAFGIVLARTIFREAPTYLAVAFAVSGHLEVHPSIVLAAVGAGVLATLLASLTPVLDLLSNEPVDAVLRRPGEAGQGITPKTRRVLAVTGLVILLATTIAVVVAPGLTVIGGITLALATFCFLPMAIFATTRGLRWIAREYHGGMLGIAVLELESAATRTVVLAGVAALAVYGSTAVGGARSNLIEGLDTATVQFFDTADIWVTAPTNDLGTTSFAPDMLVRAISRERDVASVRTYQGGLLDVGTRRLWLRARPSDDPTMLQASQILEGSANASTARLRAGERWVALSGTLATAYGVKVGGWFTLPTPSGPERFHVAAVTTNVGWPPGAITFNAADYSRYWQTSDPSALEITLKPGVAPEAGKLAVERALRDNPGLRVQTMAQRITQFENNLRLGLRPLLEISRLLLVLAALALAAALGTAIYLRRARFITLKEDGFDRLRLLRALLIESTVILGVGAFDGILTGLYGHALANRYLRLGPGFPAPFSVGGLQIASTLLIVGGVTLAVLALLGYFAAGVSTELNSLE
jgi:putative ABC transport system permease protein